MITNLIRASKGEADLENPLHIWGAVWPFALPVMLMFATSLSQSWKEWGASLLMAAFGLLLLALQAGLEGYAISLETISAYILLGGIGLFASLCVHGMCLIGRYTGA